MQILSFNSDNFLSFPGFRNKNRSIKMANTRKNRYKYKKKKVTMSAIQMKTIKISKHTVQLYSTDITWLRTQVYYL